jgi:hypothetical protein
LGIKDISVKKCIAFDQKRELKTLSEIPDPKALLMKIKSANIRFFLMKKKKDKYWGEKYLSGTSNKSESLFPFAPQHVLFFNAIVIKTTYNGNEHKVIDSLYPTYLVNVYKFKKVMNHDNSKGKTKGKYKS